MSIVVPDCRTLSIVGGLYSLSDMIFFEVLEKAGQTYIRVILQEDDTEAGEALFAFAYEDMPVDIRDIYKYVKDTSTVDDEVIYGTHIGKHQNKRYRLIDIDENTFKDLHNLELTDKMPKEYISKFSNIAENMRIVKELI